MRRIFVLLFLMGVSWGSSLSANNFLHSLTFSFQDTLRMRAVVDSVIPKTKDSLTIVVSDTATIKTRKYSSSENYKDGVIDFEIQPLGKRYLEHGPDTFKRGCFNEQFKIGVITGVHQFVPKSGWKLNPGIPVGLSLGYDFTRLHSLRLSGWYAFYGMEDTSRKLRHIGVDVDYLFNLSSYIYGYNRSRKFTLSAVLGVGYILAKFNEPQKHTFKGQAGLNLSFRVAPNVNLFAEPFFSLTYDGADHSPSNPGKYDMMYGAKVGTKIDMKSVEGENNYLEFNNKLFFEFAHGVTMFNAEYLNLAQTLGGNYQFSIGKWVAPSLGFRITANVADYCWSSSFNYGKQIGTIHTTPTYETRHKTRLLAGRGELLINPINFFKKMRLKHRLFDLNVSVGGEYGWIDKYIPGTGDGLESNYTGFTAALNVLYNIDKETALYFQPRFSLINYEVPYANSPEINKYTDEVYNISAGVRIYRPKSKNRAKILTPHFERRFFVGGQLGTLRHGLTSDLMGDRIFNISGGIYGGMHIHPLVSAKLQIDYMKIDKNKRAFYNIYYGGQVFPYDGLWKHSYGLLSTKMLYMLNISNLWQGYNNSRRLNLYMQVGPVYSHVIKENVELYSQELQYNTNIRQSNPEDVKGGLAINGGIVADISITPHWSIILQPEIDYYFKKDFIGRYNDTWSNSLIMRFSLGTSYTF